MWTEETNDHALLRELSYDIIAETAPEELPTFDTVLEGYYAVPRRLDLQAEVDRARLSEATPAVVGAVFSLLLNEIQKQTGLPDDDLARAGLRGLIRASARPNRDLRLRANYKGEPWVLSMLLYLYGMPVRITVSLTAIYYAAHYTASTHGLDEEQAERLTLAAINRLFRGATVE